MKIFLCVPFSSRVDEQGHVFPEYRGLIEDLAKFIVDKGHTYYVALEYADWIMGGKTGPKEELEHDLEEIDSSDFVIALLEERVSAGVQLENGYAYAKGKKVYIYQIGKPAWSNIAFASIAGHDIKQIEDEKAFIDEAKALIESLGN